VSGGLIDLLQRQRGSPCRALRLHGLGIDANPVRSNLPGQRRLQGLGCDLRRPRQQLTVGFLRRGGCILKRCDARLVPREGYLGRDGIKCLRDRGVFGPLAHAGAGGAGNKPKSH